MDAVDKTGNTKRSIMEIELTRGRVAIVDVEDFEELNKYKWCYSENRSGNCWAMRTLKRKTVRMHRVIMDAPPAIFVDHINGDQLDNRKINLRLATRYENAHNHKIFSTNTSGYTGVSFHRRANKWRANIWYKNHAHHLGLFNSKEEASLAYEKKAKELFGEFRRA